MSDVETAKPLTPEEREELREKLARIVMSREAAPVHRLGAAFFGLMLDLAAKKEGAP